MIILSLRSKSLDHLNLPFCSSNEKEALATIRNQVISEPDSPLSRNINDLELVKLGEFDSTLGITSNEFKPIDFDLSSFQKEV